MTNPPERESRKPSRVGGWRGGGRPKAAPDELLVPVSLRFTQPQLEKLDALGGAVWIRAKIDAADMAGKSIDERAEARVHDPAPDQVLHVKAFRMTRAQKARLAELGGGAGRRERVNRARSVDVTAPESPLPKRRGA
jgi:hypothetical protein